MKEYRAASQYFDSLPGNQDRNFHLIPPTVLKLCYNMLNRKNRPALDPRFIIPHLCKVSPSEELQCFCPPPSVVATKQKVSPYSGWSDFCFFLTNHKLVNLWIDNKCTFCDRLVGVCAKNLLKNTWVLCVSATIVSNKFD